MVWQYGDTPRQLGSHSHEHIVYSSFNSAAYGLIQPIHVQGRQGWAIHISSQVHTQRLAVITTKIDIIYFNLNGSKASGQDKFHHTEPYSKTHTNTGLSVMSLPTGDHIYSWNCSKN